jgi:hypothetical protein
MAVRSTRSRHRAPTKGFPMSTTRLGAVKAAGGLYELIAPFMISDQIYVCDDFMGDAINLDLYAVANSSGTGAANFAVSVAQNGTIAGATGTDDNGSISMVGPINVSGQQNPYFEWRAKFCATVTSLNFELGVVDAVPATNGSVLTDVDGPTWVGADAAMFSMDTDQTIASIVCASIGSATGQTSQITVLTTASSPLITPVANEYIRFGIELVHLPGATGAATDIAQAVFYINGQRVATHGDDTDGAVKASVLLAPWFYVRARAASATRTATLDYWYLIADRV